MFWNIMRVFLLGAKFMRLLSQGPVDVSSQIYMNWIQEQIYFVTNWDENEVKL